MVYQILDQKLKYMKFLSDQLSVVVFQHINYKTSIPECTVTIGLNINSSVQSTQITKLQSMNII